MSENNTDPEDTGQISVAELLARNGQKTTGISSGGRRRRGVKGGISVAELTGEIPVVRAEPASDEAPVIAAESAKTQAGRPEPATPKTAAPEQSRGKRQPEPELMSGSTTAAGDLLNQAHDESARRPYGSTASQRPTPATARRTAPVEARKSGDAVKSGPAKSDAAKPDAAKPAAATSAAATSAAATSAAATSGDAAKNASTAKSSERVSRTAGFVARNRTRSADAAAKTDITPKQPDAPKEADRPTPEVARPKTQAFGKVEPEAAKTSDAAAEGDSATAASAASTAAASTAAGSSTAEPTTSKLEVGQAEGTESTDSVSKASEPKASDSKSGTSKAGEFRAAGSAGAEHTDSESAPPGSDDDAVTEIVDAVQDDAVQDDAVHDDEIHSAGKKDAAKQWLVLLGQAVVAVIVGALLFKGFERLWDVLPWVALILSVLVIVGLVAVVRILRRTDDLISIVIAIAVGVFVTLGPLAFQLSTG